MASLSTELLKLVIFTPVFVNVSNERGKTDFFGLRFGVVSIIDTIGLLSPVIFP
jgi:hypothetical protein